MAVLDHGFWQQRFGGDPRIVGQTLTLDQEAWLVVGVVRKARVLIVTPGNAVLSAFFNDDATKAVCDTTYLVYDGKTNILADREKYLTVPLKELPSKELLGYGGVSLRQAEANLLVNFAGERFFTPCCAATSA